MSINIRRLRVVAAFAWLLPAAVLTGLHYYVPVSQAAATPATVRLAFDTQEQVTGSISRIEIAGTGSAATPRERITQTGWVANSGFEIDADENAKADTWSEAKRAFQSDGVMRTGTHSMQLSSPANSDLRVWQVIHKVQPGQMFDIGGWVNIPATGDELKFQIAVAWKDKDGQVVRVDQIKNWSGPTDGWDQGTKTLVAPVGTDQAVVRLNTSSLAATVYIDDITFQAR